jgi:transcriptional regulator with XRE-family HTH domain
MEGRVAAGEVDNDEEDPGQPMSRLAAEIGERLRMVRMLLDDNLTRFLSNYRTSATIWRQWESGKTYPDPETMVAFCCDWGCTMDWLYRADIGSLDRVLRKRLERAYPDQMARHAELERLYADRTARPLG